MTKDSTKRAALDVVLRDERGVPIGTINGWHSYLDPEPGGPHFEIADSLFAEDRETLAGGHVACLSYLHVDSRYRGKGHARKMVEAWTAAADAVGATRSFLLADADAFAREHGMNFVKATRILVGFYESVGFLPTSEYYNDNDSVFMERIKL